MGRRRKEQSGPTEAEEMYQPSRSNAGVPAAECPTRRSARQQQRQAVGASRSKVDNDFDYSPPSKSQKMQRRFLLSPKPGKIQKEESTSAVLNRLIQKRPAPPINSRGYKIRAPPPLQKRPPPYASSSASISMQQPGRAAGQMKKRNLLPTPTPAHVGWMGQGQGPLMSPKLEVSQGLGSLVQNPAYQEGPKKRGRKRKVDTMAHVVNQIKSEPGSRIVTVAQAQQILKGQQRKRGRQSAATQGVKPRFPFCSICLSDEAPNDYIINHMSCPNEYQRMKRLFVYIYKDLKFPFVPFDLERENVFDYCDLPLCDSCIVLYREMYDSYAQIEAAKDMLTSKVERLAHQIQQAENNAAAATELTLIKNSPDPLMNKYNNFRKRFSNYKDGNSRADADGSNLVQATIARVRVINQIPKRTTASQTFLTAGHFPPPAPPKTENQSTTEAGNSKTDSKEATVTVTEPPKIKVENNGNSPLKESAPAPTLNGTGNELKSKHLSTSAIASAVKINTPSTSAKVDVIPPKQSVPTASTSKAPNKPNPFAASLASILTIVKTPGGKGPAIIRKLPISATFKPPANCGSQLAKLVNNAAREQAKVTTPNTGFVPIVKDEPVEAPREQAESEESDPFLNNSSSGNDKRDGDNGQNDASSSSASEDTSDTNVFRKHKKLRVAPSDDKNESPVLSNSDNSGNSAKDASEADSKDQQASTSTSSRSSK